jgi:RNA polymerase sigma-70 factor, ECF subfamily
MAPHSMLGEARSGAYACCVDGVSSSRERADSVLVARMAVGDRGAVAALYARHVASLYSLAHAILKSRQEAEGLVYDVFLEAWQHSADYSEAGGTVRAWLLTLARSRAVQRIDSRGRPLCIPRERLAVSASGCGKADHSRLRHQLSAMPDGQRQVLVLAYFETLSTAEIAERLGIPAATVKARIRAALAFLRHSSGSKGG